MNPDERPSKRDVFLALLREGDAFLHLDARRSGVVVPAHLRNEAHLVLQYGYDLPVPIQDLEVDAFGVKATLSFSRIPQHTVVPWSAVYVVRSEDGRGVLYHEDVPEDLSFGPGGARGEGASQEGAPGEAKTSGTGRRLGQRRSGGVRGQVSGGAPSEGETQDPLGSAGEGDAAASGSIDKTDPALAPQGEGAEDEASTRPRRPTLSLVPAEPHEEGPEEAEKQAGKEEAEDNGDGGKPRRRRRPTLRLVK